MPNSPLLTHLSRFILRSPNLPLPTQEIIFNLQSTQGNVVLFHIEYRALFFLEIILPFDR